MTTKTEQGSNWVHSTGVVLSAGGYTWTEELTAQTRTLGGKSVSCKILSHKTAGYAVADNGNLYFLY